MKHQTSNVSNKNAGFAKRTIVCALSAVMLAAALCGCGGKGGSSSDAGAANNAGSGTNTSAGASAGAANTAAANNTANNAANTGAAGSGTAGANAEPLTISYARAASTTSFNLHQEITMNNAFAIDKVFEPLVMFDRNGAIYDLLAESHEISADGLTYTFKLRDGLKFNDGSDVSAEDVKFSIERHIEVGGALPIAADVQSVEAADAKTVIITLGHPFTPFISELANFANGIVPKDFGGKTEEEFFKNPVGTGPFMVQEWDPAGDLTFVKNPYYWQAGQPTVDTLIYKVVDDDNQAMNQLKAGEIDAVEELSYTAAKELDANADTTVLTQESWNVEELFFNGLDEHFADVHVRRAFALALDRDAIAASQTYGYGTKANSVLPAAISYYAGDKLNALEYNVEEAKKELAQSAFPNGFDTSVIVPSGNNVRLQEAQILQAAAKAIGINVEIRQEEMATFREDFKSFNFAIMINSATADYPDADSIFHFQVDPEGWSKCYWTSYNNPDAAELMHKGQTAADGSERSKIYDELQQILADEVPYIPLYYPQIVIGVRSEIEGLETLPNGSVSFNKVTRAD